MKPRLLPALNNNPAARESEPETPSSQISPGPSTGLEGEAPATTLLLPPERPRRRAWGRSLAPLLFAAGVLLLLLGTCFAALPVAAEGGSPAPLLGGSIVFDPTNFEQNLLTALQTAEAVRQRIEQIQNQIRQIEWMLEQVEDLEDPILRQVEDLLSDLTREMERRTEGLLYSQRDLDRTFRRIYGHGEPAEDLPASSARRLHTSLETAQAALVSGQELASAWPREQARLSRMKGQLLSSDGQLEALQGLGLLVSWVGEEVSVSTQQQAVTNNLLSVALAQWLSSEDEAVQTFREAVARSHGESRPYGSYPALPVVPPSFPRSVFGRP